MRVVWGMRFMCAYDATYLASLSVTICSIMACRVSTILCQ